jgi:hypothetical protein
MKPIRWTLHAVSELSKREIDRIEAEVTIRQPDAIAPGAPPRAFHQRRYRDAILQEPMLMRVLIEETDQELVVVTLYKTSKLKKYGGGQNE